MASEHLSTQKSLSVIVTTLQSTAGACWALAERLRSDGVDAQLDQYVAGTPPEGWPRWMLDRLE